MGFSPAIVARAETQWSRSKITLLRPQDGKAISKLSKKRFSKDMSYSYFGNGKKQVHGVETTVAVIKVLESQFLNASIYFIPGRSFLCSVACLFFVF
jgi:hypothetical protein